MIKKRKATATKKAAAASGSASLTIDYSNGVQKSFAGIACSEDTDVLAILQVAESTKPGLAFKFTVTLVSDRVGRKRGFISSIDGVKADPKNQKWLLWINDRLIGNELATNGQFGPGTTVHSGDALLFKLVSD
jgi:hypothetical protein